MSPVVGRPFDVASLLDSFARSLKTTYYDKVHAAVQGTFTRTQSTTILDASETGLVATAMARPPVWKACVDAIASRTIELIFVMMLYLSSELAIWGISRILALEQVEFFSSIVGMMFIFTVTTLVYLKWNRTDELYNKYLASKVNFINSHIGVGFPIPLIMLDASQVLSAREIGLIIANFCITNVASWSVCFGLSYVVVFVISHIRSNGSNSSSVELPLAVSVSPPQIDIPWDSTSTRADDSGGNDEAKASANTSQRTSVDIITPKPETRVAIWDMICEKLAFWYAVPLAIFFALFVGGPVLAVSNDSRILDGCVLWLVWILCVKTQRWFKTSTTVANSALFIESPRVKGTLATMMNPVLLTTLLMTGYIRVKAAAMGGDLPRALKEFSRGKPLYAIWTSGATNTPLPSNPDHYFGAGDLALSILECGILIWGFKLYECRRQLWSLAGFLTVIISVAAAAGNVFLCVLVGHAIGLLTPEALAFAARSTTLALAKPAIEAVGGNLVVNAALVVSNGIMGQLIYPFVLDKMGVKKESDMANLSSETVSLDEEPVKVYDDATTIAAGIAIGINGAAMGVAYLYETKSRAAPYAALAMTVFGVFTVVFTTVGPFKIALLAIASYY